MSSGPSTVPEAVEGSPVWVVSLVCIVMIVIAIIIEIIHYAKVYVSARNEIRRQIELAQQTTEPA